MALKVTKLQNKNIQSNQMLWDVQTAKRELGLTRYTLMRLATDAEAIVRIGDRVFLCPDKIKRYIELIAR